MPAVGFDLVLGPTWKKGKLADIGLKTNSGTVSYRSVGAESDAFLQVLDELYGTKLSPKAMAAETSASGRKSPQAGAREMSPPQTLTGTGSPMRSRPTPARATSPWPSEVPTVSLPRARPPCRSAEDSGGSSWPTSTATAARTWSPPTRKTTGSRCSLRGDSRLQVPPQPATLTETEPRAVLGATRGNPRALHSSHSRVAMRAAERVG